MFICFEGIDRAGKSTQARMLEQRYRAENKPVELVADPGTTRIGTAIRQILLDNDAPITPHAQMLLFSAARAELAAHIRERLDAGITVICDRWLLSTLVYQGELNGIDIELILTLFRATSNLVPDVCIFLDLPPDIARARLEASTKRDRYERISRADSHFLAAAYHRHLNNPLTAKNVCAFTATCSAQELHEQVYGLCISRVEGANT